MKKIFFVLYCYLLFSSTSIFAQSEEYTISGKAMDEADQPVPFVQVAIYREGQTQPEAFTTADVNGDFTLNAEGGLYTLKLFMVGYADKEITGLQINRNIKLGGVLLNEVSQQLEEVVVEASRPMTTTNMEGLVINPGRNLSNLGGTVLDILRNTPSIRVGDDGSISLRGSSGTNVLINGRNSSLTQNLDRIPASAVEQIKVINNPNARYDAEAEAGIIDIVLKKGGDIGTNFGVDALYGTRGRMNAGAQISHRTLNYNLYGGYNLRRWPQIGTNTIEREIYADGESLNQQTDSRSEDLGHTFNFGGDYYFGKNILSYEGVLNTSLDEQTDNLYSTLTENDTNLPLLEYVRINNESETDDGMDNALIYERTFDNKERSFKIIASQSYTNQFKTQNIDIYRNTSTPDPDGADAQERAITDEKRYTYVFQMDYIHPLQNKLKLETGLKANIRNFNYDYDYSRMDDPDDGFINDPTISNQFEYQDRIYAGYMVASKNAEKFNYTVGLRGEFTTLELYQYNTAERNRQQYFNLFPSVQMLYRITPKQALKLTYSRRIDRPRAWRLNPFPNITDSLSVRRGNPNLQPEMINSMEFGHVYEAGRTSIATNLFYRYTSGQMDYITFVEDGISYSQPANLNNSQSYGVEIIGTSEFTPWWTVTGSVTGFGITVDGSNLGEEFVNSGYAMNTKVTTDFKLPLNITFQMVFNYESPEIEAQGKDLAQYYLDASIHKSFFNKKAVLSVSVRDVFDTRQFSGYNQTSTFSQSFTRKNETQIVLVSARYNF